ncbi:hypothetical protein ACFL1A_01620 [Patescibacteria group bacterium]
MAAPWSGCLQEGNVATIGCLQPLVKNMVTALVGLVGIVLFIMLVVGGFNFLLAGGDMKKLEKAKGTVISALTGLVIVVIAYLILSLIKAFTGVNVTDFNVIVN